jgi:cytochrome c-type biogenesis protein CcmH/NrfG
LAEASDAIKLEPYAASPRLQEALVLEQAGDLRDALTAAKQATTRQHTNWENWLVVARLEARTGDIPAAVSAYERAAQLDPLNPLFHT